MKDWGSDDEQPSLGVKIEAGLIAIPVAAAFVAYLASVVWGWLT